MDVNSLIQSFGFPIACAIGCGWFVYKMYSDSLASNKDREEKFYVELVKSREANSKFAEIISTYTAKLDNISEDVKEIREKIDKL